MPKNNMPIKRPSDKLLQRVEDVLHKAAADRLHAMEEFGATAQAERLREQIKECAVDLHAAGLRAFKLYAEPEKIYVRPKEAHSDLIQIAQMAKYLKHSIEKLPKDAIKALAAIDPLEFPLESTQIFQNATLQLPSIVEASNNAGRRLKRTADEQQKIIKSSPVIVADVAFRSFFRITGDIGTRSVLGGQETEEDRETSPFVRLLRDVFKTLRIPDSPAYHARRAIERNCANQILP